MIESSLPPRAEMQNEPVLLPGRPFGWQARSVIGYSLLTALMVVARMPVFVPAALLHCAIRNGRRAAWAVFGISVSLIALYAASVPASTPDLQKLVWTTFAGVVLTIAVPAMAAVPMVLRADKFGRVLMFALAGALVGLALTEIAAQAFLSFSPYAAQSAQAKELGREVVQLYRDNGMPPDVVRVAERWTTLRLNVLTAEWLIGVSLIFTLSLLMLGRLSAWHPEDDARRAYRFRNLELPEWLLFAFVFGGLTPLATGLLQKVAANTLIVVAFLYVLQGLAVFRSMLLTVGAGVGGTIIGWTVLAMMFALGIGPLLVGLTGLFDSFFDFRHFKKRKDDSHESHSD